MTTPLEFETAFTELEGKLKELKHVASRGDVNIAGDMVRLEEKVTKMMRQTYETLSPWQTVQVARHPERPHCMDFIAGLITDFVPLAGDRCFGEDAALVAGLGRFQGMPVCILGTEKGHDIPTRLKHNFGAVRPEGYRKARRLMALADRFNLPILTFVDTAGAHPGKDAEERGQAEAIARAVDGLLDVRVPVIAVITGEGGSGGAIALATANHVLMFAHAIYSVVSPEGCASILWRSADKKQEAAAALKLTAKDLMGFGIIDSIVDEPLGGAHRNPQEAIQNLATALQKTLALHMKKTPDQLRQHRREKFLAIGRKGL